jgi:competence protein ComEC
MAKTFKIYIWKKATFLRLVLPLILGILLQYFLKLNSSFITVAAISIAILILAFNHLPEVFKFKLRFFQGVLLTLFLVITGIYLTWQKDIRNHGSWYGHKSNDSTIIIASINEPLTEKAKTYKALAKIERIVNDDSSHVGKGEFLIYFAKDSIVNTLKYGDRIIFKRPLQPIQNSGNPGEFDYRQFLAFKQIYHQVYLKNTDYILLKGNSAHTFKNLLFRTRDYVIETLNTYISGENESALAKALLIGYRVDLDKDLVQAYSNAGVVHLIAISGLHMALIYGLLYWIAMRLPYLKKSKITRTITILFCLWFFAFLTGASPSVMRAAVMFSFISLGSLFQKNSSIYNSLCVSAFVLLCFDPYLLWNVGFQLSYLAVLGIVVLLKPIYSWLYFKNIIADYVWKMASVSIAAQIFTIPLCFYYFHQLPILFLVANIIAIPLATLALWGSIALIALSPLDIIAVYFGKMVTGFLWLMNYSILLINKAPFALWENVSLSVFDTFLLYAIFICFIIWLLKKNMLAFRFALTFSLLFAGKFSYNKFQSMQQKKIIVYNIPKITAVDFIAGNKYLMLADSGFQVNQLLQRFHVRPAHISLSASKKVLQHVSYWEENNFYGFFGKRLLIVNSAIHYFSPNKMRIDYIILTNNAKIKIADLLQAFDCQNFIFTANNSLWRIGEWEKECEELHLRSHSVARQGAFVTNL